MNFDFKNNIAPKKGCLLLSDPYKGDEFFERSVVYICEHDETKGTLGFIINKPVQVQLNNLNPAFENEEVTSFIGGPCEQESLFFIHQHIEGVQDGLPITNEVFLGHDYTNLQKIISPKLVEMGKIKLFIGYSGWDIGQLEDEIERNCWAVFPDVSLEDLFYYQKNLWQKMMQKLGDKYKIMSQFPLDPNYN